MSEETNLQQTEGQQQTPPPVDTPEYESEARAQGWVSQEEYRGNERDWVDAETFVKRGREILPIVRKNNEKLLKELQEARKIAEEARSTAKEFQKFQKEQYERKAKDLEAQMSAIKAARREAITAGDGERVIELEEAQDALKEELAITKEQAKAEPPKPEVKEEIKPDASLQSWLDRNDWFGVDKRTTGIANGLGEALRAEYPNLQGQAFLDKLDEELAATLPDRFGKKKVANPMDVGTPSGGRPTKSKQSYDNLPAEAKSACDRFVKQGLMTREEYVADYDWTE
jgi:hypothetical protein